MLKTTYYCCTTLKEEWQKRYQLPLTSCGLRLTRERKIAQFFADHTHFIGLQITSRPKSFRTNNSCYLMHNCEKFQFKRDRHEHIYWESFRVQVQYESFHVLKS